MRHRLAGYMLALVIGLLLACAALEVRAQNVSSFQAALTNTQVSVRTTSSFVDGVLCANANAAITYLQLFNSATAVTVGTTAPYMVIPLAASGVTNLNGLYVRFPAGIRAAATTGPANAVAPGTAVVCSIILR